MDKEISEYVMIERVELIARLTADAACNDKDRAIALDLIAEIARRNLMKNKSFPVIFMPNSHHAKENET